LELHSDINRYDLWVNQFRYLNNLNDYLWFFLIILLGLYFINSLIKKLKINFFIGNLINIYHISYTFFVIPYAEKFAHDGNSIYAFAKGDPDAPLEIKFQILKGSEFLGFILIPFARIMDLSILNLSLIFSFISTTALIYFFDMVCKINSKNKLNILIALLIIFLPSLNFFTSGITKECLSITIFVYILWVIVNNKFFEKKILVLFLIIFLILLRPYMGSILFILLSTSLVLSKKSILGNLKFLKFPFFITMLTFAIYFLSLNIKFYTFVDLEQISNFILNRQRLTMTGYSYDIINTTFFLRPFIYIFGPLMIISNSIFEISLVLENLILFLSFCIIFFNICRNKVIIPKINLEFYIMIIFSLIMIFLLSNITANYGIIARSKYNFLLILWIFIFYLNKKNKLFK